MTKDNLYIVPKENIDRCYVCKKSSDKGIAFVNQSEKTFKYLPKNRKAHMECYIDLCVRKSLKKQEGEK